MNLDGEQLILAPVARVWELINDPIVLAACIPGCETLTAQSSTEMTATVALKVGPIKARFEGAVTLEDMVVHRSYRICGEGRGGIAGFAKGEALVQLEAAEAGAATRLLYEARVDIGGKLAQLGSRMLVSTANKLTAQFFDALAQKIAGASAQDA